MDAGAVLSGFVLKGLTMKDCEGNELKSGDYVRSNQGGDPVEIEIKDGLCWLVGMPMFDFQTNQTHIPRLSPNSMAGSCWVKYPKP